MSRPDSFLLLHVTAASQPIEECNSSYCQRNQDITSGEIIISGYNPGCNQRESQLSVQLGPRLLKQANTLTIHIEVGPQGRLSRVGVPRLHQ
mmetsp:Transcript_4124/g.8670  ORF Transcript_4124/g.8670 Transcript_4124/m.8670 type:complete len:92 (-) Transcript_4124:473-748(-)